MHVTCFFFFFVTFYCWTSYFKQCLSSSSGDNIVINGNRNSLQYDNIKKKAFKNLTLWVTSLFSFSHDVFKVFFPQECQKSPILSFNPLPDWFKLKQIADDILKCIQNGKKVPYRIEKIVRNREIACYK